MKNIKFIITLVVSMLIPNWVTASQTVADVIAEIRVKSSDSNVYIVKKGGRFDTPECDPIFAYFSMADNPHADRMLSLIMTAKATGAKISFSGSCATNGDYLQVDEVRIY